MAYQRKDHYHRRAKREGFRSRAAYKLAEIQRTQRLLRPGQRVIDLGCWPGGWLQVAADAVGARGRVVGLDLRPLEPPLKIENAIALCGDVHDPGVRSELLASLGGHPADVLLCDAAPHLTGVRATDQARERALLEAVETALPELLREGGTLLLKLLDGPEAQVVERRLRSCFERARSIRPRATRRGSAERYFLGRGHRASRRPESEKGLEKPQKKTGDLP